MSSFSFSVPIESVPLLDEHLTVAVAARLLSQAGGRPAIVLDRANEPLGLLFPHSLLDLSLHPDSALGSLSPTVWVTVPLIQSTAAWETLWDCVTLVQQPTVRYAIAIGEEGEAIGVIDWFALPAFAANHHSLVTIVDHFTHEVASPLMGVLGLVTLLEDERFVTLPAPYHQHIQAIGYSANRIACELERLDLVSRIHQGKLILYPEATTLASLCWQAISQVQDQCPSSREEDATSQPGERVLPSGAIETVSLWIDRRYGLHLLAAAIECVLGRYGNWMDLWLSVEVIQEDLVVSFQSHTTGFVDNQTSQSVQATMPPDRLETLCFLQTLVDFFGGDVSLKPNSGEGFYLDLLLPNVAIAEEAASQSATRARIATTPSTDPARIPPIRTSSVQALARTLPTPSRTQQRVVASKRVLVLTQRLSGDELALLEQPGWYVAIALSIRELSAKIVRLSPQLVILDCETHELYGQLLPHITAHWKGQAIATIREQPTTAPSSPLGSRVQSIPDTFVLRYPLQAAEVTSCFQWASIINSTLIVLDLQNHPGDQARSSEPTLPLVDQLRRHHYRTIAVNDLKQAQLFAEIWQPHVIVLYFSGRDHLESWPQRIEDFANQVKIPCLVIQFDDCCGQASRRDRSIVYWPIASPLELRQTSEARVLCALQWLQYHYPIIDIN